MPSNPPLQVFCLASIESDFGERSWRGEWLDVALGAPQIFATLQLAQQCVYDDVIDDLNRDMETDEADALAEVGLDWITDATGTQVDAPNGTIYRVTAVAVRY